MVVEHGQVWWADLDDPIGSRPRFRRPGVIVRADSFNRSRLETTIAPAITSNLDLLGAPGNVLPPAAATGLPKDSVVNVTQLLTIDHERLIEPAGLVRRSEPDQVARGLRLVLDI